eukprot:Hpha_TRINITY_DN15648_c1_g10::TRINITY_DN15648_c1_g10_i1::g.99729::m.99729
MLAACVLAAGVLSSAGTMNITNATTPDQLLSAAQAYFDFVNLGFVRGPEVQTTGGTVGGVSHLLEGVDIFWNIPFAADTSGANRFGKPVDPEPWSGVRREHSAPRWCPQMRIFGFFFGHEDCLQLNVFRPRGMKKGEKLPVMVWLYGGAFVLGDSVELGWYNGKNLATTQNVIVVTLNYRLGSLGFLALDELKEEQGTAGNWGLLDQQKALQWVQANIGNFGGDAGRVTIFGESAGGCSVVGQLSMPSSRGLFHAAIAESPLSAGDIAWAPWKNATGFGQAWAHSVGCNSTGASQVDCLRSLPLKSALSPLLLEKLPAGTPQWARPRLLPLMPWWPTIDGTTFPASPIDQAQRGEIADVPVMLGTNKNEGSIFLPMIPLVLDGTVLYPLSDAGLPKTLRHFFNQSDVDKILAQYPLSTGGDYPFRASRVAAHVLRDWLFACAGRRFLRALNSAGRKSSVYMYHFEYQMKGLLAFVAGDYHGSELSFVFDNAWLAHTWPTGTWSKKDKKLAIEMGSYWASFARNSNTPSPMDNIDCKQKNIFGKSECITFPRYTETESRTGNASYMVWDEELHTGSNLFQEQCDFWDTQIGYEGLYP